MKQISATKAFECDVLRFEHKSSALGGLKANFSVILPPPQENQRAGLLLWLSGLTCTDENFVTKAGAAAHALKYNVAISCPDTSPRGAGAPGEDDTWDFGTGAGFYVDAKTDGFDKYQMETYVMKEFLALMRSDQFSKRINSEKIAISGHSMGGMGALQLALRYPDQFCSVSAFSPIANPTKVPWGQKCFAGYLGNDEKEWEKYDPTELVRKSSGDLFDNILVEQGTADGFLEKHLKPDRLVEACKAVGQKVSCACHESEICYIELSPYLISSSYSCVHAQI